MPAALKQLTVARYISPFRASSVAKVMGYNTRTQQRVCVIQSGSPFVIIIGVFVRVLIQWTHQINETIKAIKTVKTIKTIQSINVCNSWVQQALTGRGCWSWQFPRDCSMLFDECGSAQFLWFVSRPHPVLLPRRIPPTVAGTCLDVDELPTSYLWDVPSLWCEGVSLSIQCTWPRMLGTSSGTPHLSGGRGALGSCSFVCCTSSARCSSAACFGGFSLCGPSLPSLQPSRTSF